MPVSTTHAQAMAREALRTVGIDVASDTDVVLTDGDRTGLVPEGYLVNPSQVAGAAEQLRLVTGESIDGDGLVANLPWKESA